MLVCLDAQDSAELKWRQADLDVVYYTNSSNFHLHSNTTGSKGLGAARD